MAAEWSRVVNSTIKNYIKEVEVNTLRNRRLSALMKKRGRITYNWSGIAMDWKVKFKRYKPTPFGPGDTMTFARKDRYKTATLDWRGYNITDSMEKSEYLKNRGKEAIINTYSQIAKDLMEDVEDFFGEEMYINGYAAGNEQRLHGIESFMGATLDAGNGAGTPNQTNYAGLSCVLAAYGGSWQDPNATLTWPSGRGDAQYDFWSPIVVDYGSTLFSATAKWANNCIEAIAYGRIKSQKSKSKRGQLDLFLMDDEMFRIYLSKLREKEQIQVNRGEASELVSMGFHDVVNQDGIDITSEFGIPGAVGYGWNMDMLELRSMQGQLFVPDGPTWVQGTKSWNFSIDFYGNLVFNPRSFVKLQNLTDPNAALS